MYCPCPPSLVFFVLSTYPQNHPLIQSNPYSSSFKSVQSPISDRQLHHCSLHSSIDCAFPALMRSGSTFFFSKIFQVQAHWMRNGKGNYGKLRWWTMGLGYCTCSGFNFRTNLLVHVWNWLTDRYLQHEVQQNISWTLGKKTLLCKMLEQPE